MHSPIKEHEDQRTLEIRAVENGYCVEAKVLDPRIDLHVCQRWTKRTYVYATLTDALEAANKYFTAEIG